jgi:CRP-like cAMP-binding protein
MEFAVGDSLIEQGRIETHAFVIESGSVKILVRDNGQDQVLGIAGVGDVVGEMGLFEDAPRSASVVALERTVVRRVSRKDLRELMEMDPRACMPFLHAILDRLRTSNTMLAAAQQTRQLIKTLRIRLSFEPVSEEASKICPVPSQIELEVVPEDAASRLLIQGLQQHFKVVVEAFHPEMQR